MTKLEKIIAQNIKEQNPHLKLSRCGLTGREPIWQELAAYTHLRSLDLSRNAIEETGFLKALPATLEELDLEGIGLQTLPSLGVLPALKRLNLRYNALSDLTPLGAYQTLEELYFHTNAVADLSPLSELKNLRILEFPRNKVKDISPLAELERLEVLSMESNRIQEVILRDMPCLRRLEFRHNQTKRVSLRRVGVENLHVKRGGEIELGNLPHLHTLILSHYADAPLPYLYGLPALRTLRLHKPKTGNLRFLLALKSLEKLHLSTGYITFDLASFAPMPNLKSVHMEGANLDLLQNMPDIERLKITANRLASLAPLAYVPRLKMLEIEKMKCGDLGALENLTDLEYLDFKWSEIVDISPLASLTKLRELFLYGNKITDLTPLQNLHDLETLDLAFNGLKCIEPLRGLKALGNLVLRHNCVTDIEPLRELKALTSLDLRRNQIRNFEESFLADWEELKTLDLADNPIEGLPDVVLACLRKTDNVEEIKKCFASARGRQVSPKK